MCERTAIEDEALPGHEPGAVRVKEERYGLSDPGRRADSPKRRALDERALGVRAAMEPLAQRGRVDRAGSDGVHANAVRGELDRGRAREGVEATLARGVR